MLISGEGGVGFARGICVTGVDDAEEVTFQKSGIVFTTLVKSCKKHLLKLLQASF